MVPDCAMCRDLPVPLPFRLVRIQYSGPPGSAVAEVSGVESSGNLVVDSHVQNEGNGWAGSGANPWHLDEDTESILFLTNESDQPAHIGFKVTANGNPSCFLTSLLLNPHETRAIDLRKLRDAQKPDFKKNKIPAAAADGSVIWVRAANLPVSSERSDGGARRCLSMPNSSSNPSAFSTRILSSAGNPTGGCIRGRSGVCSRSDRSP
jgi:hypothetical protein